jgi:ATP-binding cassette, subfamily B, bacterial
LAEALEHARCDFIEYMPHGLDTEIGERGVRLSGGERQRLAIARIFLRNPEILVLDEPTSALDSFSESAITEALHNLFENKTVIVVAHRLQTVKEADAIVVLGPEGILEK